jgi:hypothetical protein
VRDRDGVQEVLDELTIAAKLRAELPNALGIALSLTDVVRDVIPGPTAPDLLRIYKAYKKAEKNLDA